MCTAAPFLHIETSYNKIFSIRTIKRLSSCFLTENAECLHQEINKRGCPRIPSCASYCIVYEYMQGVSKIYGIPSGMTSSYVKPPCPESVSKLYRPSNHRLSAKLVPTVADRGCHVISMTEIPMAVFLAFQTGAATFSSK
jgi:hypothetical protein